jgi:hypothetical protein
MSSSLRETSPHKEDIKWLLSSTGEVPHRQWGSERPGVWGLELLGLRILGTSSGFKALVIDGGRPQRGISRRLDVEQSVSGGPDPYSHPETPLSIEDNRQR